MSDLVYTVFTSDLLSRSVEPLFAEHVEELLVEIYDPFRVEQYDVTRYTPPHFKVTTLNQSLVLLAPYVSHIAEVDAGDLELIEREYPGHNDGVSKFTTYTGYCAPVIRLKRLFDLTNIDDIETLVRRGLFENDNFMGGGHEGMFIDWLFASGNEELYFEWKDRLGLPDDAVMDYVLDRADPDLLEESLGRVDVSVWALIDALEDFRADPLADALFDRLQAMGEEIDESAASVFDIVVKREHWNRFTALARYVTDDELVEKWLVKHGFKVPEDDLMQFLRERYSESKLPASLIESFVLRHRMGLIEPWIDMLCQSPDRADWLNLALFAGFDSLVDELDPMNVLRVDLEHEQAPRFEEVLPNFRSRLENALETKMWFLACRRDVPLNERDGLDSPVVKAVEAGYFGLIRWLDLQGVDVRPSGNVTARIARRRGYDVMADYLDDT